MFGWLMIIGTAEARNHGLMPEGNLDQSQWGVLGSLGDGSPISMERAAIIVAHIHFLFVSVAATLAPFSFQDKLLLEEGEADEAPAGLFPAFKGGLTKSAEIWNGRVAMGKHELVALCVHLRASAFSAKVCADFGLFRSLFVLLCLQSVSSLLSPSALPPRLLSWTPSTQGSGESCFKETIAMAQ